MANLLNGNWVEILLIHIFLGNAKAIKKKILTNIVMNMNCFKA